MNPFLTQVVIQTTLRPKMGKKLEKSAITEYELAKAYRELIITVKRTAKDILFIIAGLFSASFGLKGFLLPSDFIDGGATGISLLLSEITKMPLAVLIIGVNIPFVLLGYKIMGRLFVIKTALAIAGLSLCLATVDFPEVTHDNLLVAVLVDFF
jgi:uncharacterized membrane-anchored protein YitT (DUF2179 family)